MGRPQTIYVDRDALLVAIVHAHRDHVAQLAAEVKRLERQYRRAKSGGYEIWKERSQVGHILDDVAEYGTPCDLERFAGHGLTSSERIRHQEAIRSLESQGLVLRSKRDIRPTDAGRDKAAKLAAAKAAPPVEAADA